MSKQPGTDADTTIQALRDKMAYNARKYPVELFNKNRVGTEDYDRIKETYRNNKKTA